MTNERFRRMVELSPDGILICQDEHIAFANPAAARIFAEHSPATLVGVSLTVLFDADSRDRIRDCATRLLAHATVLPIEERVDPGRAAVSGVSDVELTGTLIDDEDGRAIQLIVRDITERKRTELALRQSEERLTLAFEGAQEGVWDWNLDTGVVVYSPRWKQMLGYGDDEIEPHVSAWERLLHPDDLPRANEVQAAVDRGDRMYEGEFRLRHKDGHYTPVLSRGFPVRREPGGPVVRIVGTHFDLTERRRAESERARTELLGRLVFAQEDERRRIAREMHDQFGEHLTSLSRTIEAMKEASRGDADCAPHVTLLEQIVKRLDRDVDHLVWQLRPTALDDLGLRAALANYVQDWSRRVRIPADLHASGLLDERLPPEAETTLYRIAQEALTNIANHSRASKVDIILERQADSVVLIVEDNGVGFDHEAAPAPRDDGGFGLLGMHERAALVGAQLQIESTPGTGTTILLRLSTPAGEAR